MRSINFKDSVIGVASKEKVETKERNTKKISDAIMNDGMNTPVPGKVSIVAPSKSEAALVKQAENPLGDPDKI
jgi:hypothetical protein